ncbi:MAG: hypothetical protein JWN70_3172 [Planctomycetaceae bacterium]|nr:hypothetical protein [Planctomycetaceae bacterium]
MSIRPGRNLLRIAGVCAVFAFASFLWPMTGWLLLAMVLITLSYVVWDFRDLASRYPQIKVMRVLPNVVGRDLKFQVEWRIEHDGRQPLSLELRDQLPPTAVPPFQTIAFDVPAGETGQTLSSEFRLPVRGTFEFGPIWLRTPGPRGLLEAQWSVNSVAAVKVLPESFSTGEALKHDKRAAMLLLDKMSQARQQGVGTEFDQLSEFRDGDDPRRIDWRTSARFGRPIVRRFRVERHRDVMLLIDCGRLMGADAVHGTKLDCAVDSALMLGRTVLEGGDRCGLGLFDDQVLGYLPPVTGSLGLRALTESVCSVQSRWREADFTRMFATLQSRQSKRSLLVILSDIIDEATSTRFRASMGALCRRHVVLFAALQTPLLRQFTRAPVGSIVDGARKAVAFRLLREREVALQSLRHSGVHVVDVEPNELTIPLINQFIELRQGNLL